MTASRGFEEPGYVRVYGRGWWHGTCWNRMTKKSGVDGTQPTGWLVQDHRGHPLAQPRFESPDLDPENPGYGDWLRDEKDFEWFSPDELSDMMRDVGARPGEPEAGLFECQGCKKNIRPPRGQRS